MDMLSSNFDVARYMDLEYGRNHMAALLNMDIQMIFVKKIRCFLRNVMEYSDINCLFYKLYSDPTVMKQVCNINLKFRRFSFSQQLNFWEKVFRN